MPDRQLVAQAARAPTEDDRRLAFTEIFARYHPVVLVYCAGKLQDPHAAADAASATFEYARGHLDEVRQPDRLRGWLVTVARSECYAVWRREARELPTPDWDAEPEREADVYERESRERKAEVDRLLGTVVASFTDRQQQLFELTVRQGLRGAALAAAQRTTPEQASRDTNEIVTLAFKGFGALVLAQAGSRYCPDLARILDTAAWNGQNFTAQLRQRVVRHFDDCKICERCSTCGTQRANLVRPLAPVLIPILVAAALKDKILGPARAVASAIWGAATRTQRGRAARVRRRNKAAASVAVPSVLLLIWFFGVSPYVVNREPGPTTNVAAFSPLPELPPRQVTTLSDALPTTGDGPYRVLEKADRALPDTYGTECIPWNGSWFTGEAGGADYHLLLPDGTAARGGLGLQLVSPGRAGEVEQFIQGIVNERCIDRRNGLLETHSQVPIARHGEFSFCINNVRDDNPSSNMHCYFTSQGYLFSAAFYTWQDREVAPVPETFMTFLDVAFSIVDRNLGTNYS